MRTVDYLNAVKARYALTSDYQLAAKMGLSRGNISLMQSGRGFMGDDTAAFVAQLLDLPPARVIAHANAERARRANQPTLLEIWLGVAAKYGATTAAGLAILGAGLVPPAPANASSSIMPRNGSSIYIMSTQSGLRTGIFANLLGLVLPLFF